MGLVEYLPQVRPAVPTEVLRRFDLVTVVIEEVPMVAIRAMLAEHGAIVPEPTAS